MSGIRLFQVGQIPLPAWRQNIIEEYDVNKRGDTISPLKSINIISTNHRWLNKERNIKFAAHLFSGANFPARYYENVLRQYVGATVPIIAYEFLDNDIVDFRSCCDGYKKCDCGIRWLIAYGVIDNVAVTEARDLNHPKNINFTIDLLTYWSGLNDYLWGYPSGVVMESIHPVVYSALSPSEFPTCDDLIDGCSKYCKGFTNHLISDRDFIFNEDYFNTFVGEHCLCCGIEYGQYGVNLNKFLQVEYIPSNLDWNAPPKTIVRINGFNDTNNVYFVTVGSNLIDYTESKTIIDVQATNTILVDNGYNPLDSNTSIILGDFSYNTGTRLLRDTLIIQNGVILDIQPVVSYPDLFPAMVYPSNASYFTIMGNIDDWSYWMNYRRI